MALTVKVNCPLVFPSGLMTSTLHSAAAVEKVGLITILVEEKEEMERLANTSPVRLSRSVTLQLDWKFDPVIVNACALFEPVAGLGETEEIVGDEPPGALTVKANCPLVFPSGLITSTLHSAAAVEKVGLITILVEEKEEMERLAKISPVRLSRSVTLQPVWKFDPVIVNACALLDPVTGLGETEEMVGDGAEADGVWK